MLKIEDIEKILPHRYPFLLVDRVLEIEEGKFAKGIKMVSANEGFFEGHFPKEKVMPGVLIIEAMAQLGAIAILSLDEWKGKTPYFGGIKKARFRKKVIPGDCLEMEVNLGAMKMGVGQGKAKAFVDGELACEAELLFAMGE